MRKHDLHEKVVIGKKSIILIQHLKNIRGKSRKMKTFSMSYSVATIMSFLKNDYSMHFQSGEMSLVGPRHTSFEVVIIH